jgi:hypothetical protein
MVAPFAISTSSLGTDAGRGSVATIGIASAASTAALLLSTITRTTPSNVNRRCWWPGCTLVLPIAGRSFATLCQDVTIRQARAIGAGRLYANRDQEYPNNFKKRRPNEVCIFKGAIVCAMCNYHQENRMRDSITKNDSIKIRRLCQSVGRNQKHRQGLKIR